MEPPWSLASSAQNHKKGHYFMLCFMRNLSPRCSLASLIRPMFAMIFARRSHPGIAQTVTARRQVAVPALQLCRFQPMWLCDKENHGIHRSLARRRLLYQHLKRSRGLYLRTRMRLFIPASPIICILFRVHASISTIVLSAHLSAANFGK